MKRHWMLVTMCAAFGAAVANAQTLYKLIDKHGKVTYSESAPKPGEFDGQVIRIDVNPQGNTAQLPRLQRTEPPPASTKGAAPPTAAAAREKLEAARNALASARDNPSPEEVRRVGTTKGFTRPVETDDYKAKLEKLEADVKQAEEELRRAEGR